MHGRTYNLDKAMKILQLLYYRKVNDSIQSPMELLLLNETKYLSKIDLVQNKMCSTKAPSLIILKFYQY